MFRFQNPDMFYLLIAILLLFACFIYSLYLRKKRLQLFGDPEIIKQLMPNASYIRPRLKFYIVVFAMFLIVVALARPQFGSSLQTNTTKGVEAMMVLDVSNSMMANDVLPTRLDNAKMLLSKLIDQMPDDKLGLIVFAGDAYIQLPVTSDNVSAKMFLSSITTNSVPIPGTALGTAIDLAISAFGEQKSDIGRTIILITDGENHEDDAIAAAKLAKESGITVNVVGIGSPQGSPIPVQGTMSFWKDSEDKVVISKLNEQMCQEVAAAGGGSYVRADNSNIALRVLSREIDAMQKGKMEVKSYSTYDEQFHVMAWIAMFLLVVEFFIFSRKNKKLSKINLFD